MTETPLRPKRHRTAATLLLVCFGIVPMLDTVPSASAADLALQPVRKVVRGHHKRTVARIVAVRDLDGTPIIVRRAPAMMLDSYGAAVLPPQYVNIPVSRPQPKYYLNGEPVLPPYPRSWPRQFTSRF
jgi:hypothetical protein